jgi:hypothetical protein
VLPAETCVVEFDSVSATATAQNMVAIRSLVLVMKGLRFHKLECPQRERLRILLLNDSGAAASVLSGDYRFCRTVGGLDCTEKLIMSELGRVETAHGAGEADTSFI